MAAVVDHSAYGCPAEPNTMIAALTSDEPGAVTLPTGAVIGEGNFQGGIDRFRSRIGEKDPFKSLWRDCQEALGKLKGDRVSHLKGRGKIHG